MTLPAPFWSDDLVSIYCGDALDLLDALAPSSVAAVVTDPPYVIGAVSAGNMASKSGGWHDMMNSALWFSTWYRKVDRVLHSTGHFWSFCNWRTLPVVMRAASDASMPLASLLVWDKEWIGPGGPQALRPSYELVAYMPQERARITDRGVPDVWRHQVGAHKPHGHTAEKPEGLLRRVLEVCDLPPDALVVDPFMGSGSTLAAARSLGVRSIGFDGEAKWCEVAAARLSQRTFELGGS